MRSTKSLDLRVRQLESQVLEVETNEANRRRLGQEIVHEAKHSLRPSMWDWILQTPKDYKSMEPIEGIAYHLAIFNGWKLHGGYGGEPYFWSFNIFRSSTSKEIEHLYYLLGCSRAEFAALPQTVQDTVWEKACERVTKLLDVPEFQQLRCTKEDAYVKHKIMLQMLKLPKLLEPHLPPPKNAMHGSKKALLAWHKEQKMKPSGL